MTFLSDLLGMIAFRRGALKTQAGQQSLLSGVLCFAAGYLVFGVVRSAVYATLPDFAGQSGVLNYLVSLRFLQVVLFLLLVYIPAVIILSNAIAGEGLGWSVSREEYRAHGSALLPLWGLLFLLDAPFQYYAPQFLVVGVFGITIGMLVLLVLLTVYTVWGLQQLNYLSSAQAIAVFVLSWFTIPIYYFLVSFLFALPLFLMIPVLYLGYYGLRVYSSSQSNERLFKQRMNSLTLNPQDADAHYQLGLLQLKRRRPVAACRHFEDAIRIDASDPDYHYALGRAHELAGEWEKALAEYEETYRLNPEYGLGDIFREVGKGYLQTGNLEKGIEFLRFFLSKRNSDPEGRYWLAVALQKSGDIEQMRVQLNTILDQVRSDPRFFRKGNREWIYKTRALIRDSKPALRG
jgi:tetratricopeptide (TPR) repeat protein